MNRVLRLCALRVRSRTPRTSRAGERGGDEAEEERVRGGRAGLELRVELARDEVGVARKLDDFREGSVGRDAAHAQPRRLQRPARLGVHRQLVAVAVPLGNA